MECTLNMVFLTAGGKKTTFAVTDVDSAITNSQVNSLMDTIIAQNIFTTTSGDLVKKSSANIVSKQSKEIKMA